MQPDLQGQPTQDPYGQPQPVMIDPVTGMPANVIMIQPTSGAPKVIGIFIIIFAVLSGLASIASIGDALAIGGLFLVLHSIGILVSVGTGVGGAMMVQYQKRGVHLVLAMIFIGLIIGVANMTMFDDLLEQQDGDMTVEEQEFMDANSGLFAGIGMAVTIICQGLCGLIVAIPLMVSNNGLDDSKLFG